MGYKKRMTNGGIVYTDKLDPSLDVGLPAAVSGVTVKNVAFGGFVQTTITLNDVAQAVVNGTEYQGTKIYNFPECRMYVVTTVATLQQKTTSAIASTLNSGVTGAIALGTATASNVSLTSTMVDILPSTAFTTSTTINVAGTAVTAVLAAAAFLDGTATAKSLYLNTAYATTTDVDADATQTISGTIVITWVNCGDK